MGNDIKTSVIVDLKGNLARQAKRNEQAVSRFSRNSSRNLHGLSRSVKTVNKTFGSMGKKLAGIAAAAASIRAISKVMDLEERYERLGVQANKSSAEMAALKKEIFDISKAPDIRVDPTKMLEAVTEIVEKTGDLEFAEKNIRNIGLALQATGAGGTAIGGIMAELQKMDIKNPEKVIEALDILNVQGKQGAFTLANIAALGPRLFSAYASTGRGGIEAIREMGAALQVIRMTAGSSEQATTAFEALLATFSDAKKIKMLQQRGIQVFDVEALKQGKEILRPINELMTEITESVKGKKTILSRLFPEREARKAFNRPIIEYQTTGKVTSLPKFMGMQADGRATIADSARMAKTSNASARAITTTIEQTADAVIGPALKDTADAFDNSQSADGWTNAKAVGYAAASVIAAPIDWGFDSFNYVADLTVGTAIRELKTLFAEKPEATIKLDVEAKNATVKTKEMKAKNLEVEVNSGKTMVSP